MTTPGDNSSDPSSENNGGNSGGDRYRANRWSDPSGSSSSAGGYPSFGASPRNDTGGPPAGTGQDSLFSALFDFSFTRYATPSIIKFAYALGFAFITLIWLGYLFFVLFVPAAEFGVGGLFLGLLGVVVLTVGALFMLMSLRMMLEFYLSNIRIAQSAQSIDRRLLDRDGRTGPGGDPSGRY